MSTRRAAQAGKYERVKGDGYAGVYERNGQYVVSVWNPEKGEKGGKDWHTLGLCSCGRVHPGTTKADARDLKRELEREKRERKNSGAHITVDEWAGRYEDDRWIPGKWLELCPRPSPSTNKHNDSRIRAFARAFAGRTLESITEQEAAQFAVDNAGSLKEVHAALNDALALKLITRNPFAGLRQSSRRGRRGDAIDVLTDDDLKDLCGLAKVIYGSYGPVFAAMIQTAAWTGLRPGELFLLALEPDDHLNHADVDEGVLHVNWQLNGKTGEVTRPKNNSQREVALLPGAIDALKSVQRTQRPGLPLFLTKRGRPFTQRTHFYYWSPVRDAFVASRPAGHHLRKRLQPGGVGGDGNLDFYELRHFFGTKLAHPPAGVPPSTPQDIAEMMGHQDGGDLAMRVYIHTRNDDARDRIRAAWRRAS